MSLTKRAYEIVQDAFVSNEDQIISRVAETWPKEYQKATSIMVSEDPNADPKSGPNLSMVCESVKAADEKRFLDDLRKFVNELGIR